MENGETSITVAAIEWERFAPVFCAARTRALLDGLPEVRRILTESSPAAPLDSEWGSRLAGLTEPERTHLILEMVRAEVAEVLADGEASSIAADQPLKELGLASLGAAELRTRLGAASGLSLQATAVFNHPTVAALAAYLQRYSCDAKT